MFSGSHFKLLGLSHNILKSYHSESPRSSPSWHGYKPGMLHLLVSNYKTTQTFSWTKRPKLMKTFLRLGTWTSDFPRQKQITREIWLWWQLRCKILLTHSISRTKTTFEDSEPIHLSWSCHNHQVLTSMSSGCACKIHPTRAVSLELLTLCSYHPHQSCNQRSRYCAQFLLTLCTINTPLIFINGLMTDSASAYSCINIKVKKVKQRRTQNNPRIQMDGSHIHIENIKFHRVGRNIANDMGLFWIWVVESITQKLTWSHCCCVCYHDSSKSKLDIWDALSGAERCSLFTDFTRLVCWLWPLNTGDYY